MAMRINVRVKNELEGDSTCWSDQEMPQPDDTARDEELIIYEEELGGYKNARRGLFIRPRC